MVSTKNFFLIEKQANKNTKLKQQKKTSNKTNKHKTKQKTGNKNQTPGFSSRENDKKLTDVIE